MKDAAGYHGHVPSLELLQVLETHTHDCNIRTFPVESNGGRVILDFLVRRAASSPVPSSHPQMVTLDPRLQDGAGHPANLEVSVSSHVCLQT